MKSVSEIKKIGWGFGRCNQFCKHCYNASSSRAPEYTFAQLKFVADKICSYVDEINYGTGEFFINPNSVDLCEYITDSYPRIKQAITSNGSTIVMMRPEKIGRLFHDVDISLDFPEEKRHCDFRNHKKAWQWATDALEILASRNISRSVVTCVNSETTNDDIVKLIDIARKYEANWRINWFRCVGRGDEKLRISGKRAWEIIQFLSDKVTFHCLDSVFAGPLGIESGSCPAGHFSCRIHENMETSCYPFLKGAQWSGGNLLNPKISLNDVYNSSGFRRVRERSVSYCKDCDFVDTCSSGCVTRAFLHNGGINTPDDYCPRLSEVSMDYISKIELDYVDDRDLVHDGYLCTTIVSPR
ncbi:radical SAM/SPASM domain-containing protein [Patescibacteria group bacterium]